MTKIHALNLTQYQLNARELDQQHDYFEQLIERLSKTLIQSNASIHRETIMIELNSFARFHFISEENLMKLANFPDYKAHKAQHRELLGALEKFESKLDTSQSKASVDNAFTFLIDWFGEHTATMDKLFFDFLMRQKLSGDNRE